MTSKLSSLTAAAARSWVAGNKIPAQGLNELAGTAAFVQGGAGNRPLLTAQNTTGVTTTGGAWVDLTFDTYTDYDGGFDTSGKAQYTAKTAGYYAISVSQIPFGYPNPSGTPTYGLQYLLNGTAFILSYMPHASFTSISSSGLWTMSPGASFTLYLNVNDTFKFQVRCAGGGFNIPASSVSGLARPTLSIQWVSA